MKKKNTLIVIGVVIALLLALTVVGFFLFLDKPKTPEIVQILNLNIDHGSDWSYCYLNFTVTNLYNYPVTIIGSIVNRLNYGYSNITIPSGQTADESLILPHLVITSQTNYNTTLAFTFSNGQYQDYSQSILPPKYIGAFYITAQSLTETSPNSTVYSATIQNTGNIPIISANYTIGNYEASMPLYENLMPNQNVVLNGQPILSSSIQTGLTYSTTLQVKYADGSTGSVLNSLSALATPTPSPTISTSPSSSSSLFPTVTPLTSPAGEYSASGTKVLFITSMGDIVIQMRDDKPITTTNFVNLVNEGYYNGTIFQRVLAGFMIQGGEGSTTKPTIQDEIGNDNVNKDMTIAMANTGAPNSASTQFFINVANNNNLYSSFDTSYTVFGQVIYGQNVVMAISNVPVEANAAYNGEVSQPVTPVNLIGAVVMP